MSCEPRRAVTSVWRKSLVVRACITQTQGAICSALKKFRCGRAGALAVPVGLRLQQFAISRTPAPRANSSSGARARSRQSPGLVVSYPGLAGTNCRSISRVVLNQPGLASSGNGTWQDFWGRRRPLHLNLVFFSL